MELTYEQLRGIQEELLPLAEQESDSVEFSALVGNNLIQLEAHFKALVEMEKKVASQNIEKDEHDQAIVENGAPKWTDVQKLERELAELYAVKITVSNLTPISLDLFTAAKIKTSGRQMARLRPILKFKE